ncbi:MAG: hypothetical protein KA187_02850 [Arenimonas sp.]|nr:hypothetical protein [Arenimonas sp.]
MAVVVFLRHRIRKRHIVALLAGVAVACGAAIGYAFILKSVGLASLESDGS